MTVLLPTATQFASQLITAVLVLLAAACCGAIWLLVDWAIDYHAAKVFFTDEDAAPKTDEQRKAELDALRILAEAARYDETRTGTGMRQAATESASRLLRASLTSPAVKGFRRTR